MRRATIGILALGAVSVAGCGGGAHFANNPRPATPDDVTVYINNSRVLVSPNSIGAGPVIFIITNQSNQAQALTIQPSGGGSALASTAPINPQATSSIQVNFKSPNSNYVLTTGTAGATDASNSTPSAIQPANFAITAARPNANNVLLQP
jgi:uncharacterized protein involved in exopolysaccharide biosynthesis